MANIVFRTPAQAAPRAGTFVVASLLLALSLPLAATAQTVLASSSFDTDTEGWHGVDFFFGTPVMVNPFQTSSYGGSLFGFAPQDSTGFAAPGYFVQAGPQALGGMLQFEMLTLNNYSGSVDLVRLGGAGVELVWRDQVAGIESLQFRVPLKASAGWWTVGPTPFSPRTPTTEAEFGLVMNNLSRLHISHGWEPDEVVITYLQGARLVSAVPEPATALLLALGALALVARRAARRQPAVG
jgi:Laminin B (Domain IV)/PEP-CTERM motif